MNAIIRITKTYLWFSFLFIALDVLGNKPDASNFSPGQMNILPPSPTSAALGVYGLIPVTLSTGTPDIEIPLYSANYRELALNVSLSYRSNGIKVDEIASWVGLGWTLNAGGVITRIVRDEPDEDTLYPYPEDKMSDVTHETLNYLDAAQTEGFDSEPDLYMFNFMGHTGKFVIDRHNRPVIMPHQLMQIERVSDGTAGSELNFIITMPDGVKYYFEEEELSKTESRNCGKNFSYYITTSCYLTRIVHPSGASITLNYDQTSLNYDAHLYQMYRERVSEVDGCGGQSCMNYAYPDPCVNALRVVSKKLRSVVYNNDSLVFNTSSREDMRMGKKLDEILVYINGVQTKRFEFIHTYSYATSYTNAFTTNYNRKRLFLTGVKEWDKSGLHSKDYIFDYDNENSLPPRLSYAQDHWGFFNGVNNDELVPNYPDGRYFKGMGANREPSSLRGKIGLLTGITYPTKGTTTFDYEANSYYGTKVIEEFDTYYFHVSTDSPLILETDRDTLVLTEDMRDDVLIIASASVNPSHIGHEYVKAKGIIKMKNLDTGQQIIYESFNLDENKQSAHSDNLVQLFAGTYEITLMAREFVRSAIQFTYKTGEHEVQTDIPVGGVRIGKITSNNGNEDANVKSYYYGPYNAPTNFSGTIPQKPKYFSYFQTFTPCPAGEEPGGPICIGIECNYIGLHSTSQINLFPYSGNHIYYRYVLEVDGANFTNGSTEHEFIINPDLPGRIIRGEDIPTAPYTNFGWNNGLEKRVTVRNSSGDVIYEKINEWKKNDLAKVTVNGLVVQQRYNPVCTGDFSFDCDASNVNREYKIFTCVASHKHVWLMGGFPFGNGETRCISLDGPGPDNKWVIVGYHPCYGKTEGSTVLLSYAMDHLNVLEYQNIAYWQYLGSTIEKQIDENGHSVSKKTTYNYDNLDHIQLTSIDVQTSTGELKTTKYYYPDDYDSAYLNFAALDEHFIKSIPVRVDNYKGNDMVGSQVVAYNDIGQVKRVYKLNSNSKAVVPFTDNLLIPNSDYNESLSLSYNASNSLVSKLPITGLSESYIWNAEGDKIVASCNGAEHDYIYYNGFENASSSPSKTGLQSHDSGSYTITGFNPPSTAGLKMSYWYYQSGNWKYSGELDYSNTISSGGTRIDEIRVYPEGAFMTTYNYDDQDRIMDTTDPNGITEYYMYDDFGRLKLIKDENGNIVQHYEYHYKEQ